jgi:hypothetical protein
LESNLITLLVWTSQSFLLYTALEM